MKAAIFQSVYYYAKKSFTWTGKKTTLWCLVLRFPRASSVRIVYALWPLCVLFCFYLLKSLDKTVKWNSMRSTNNNKKNARTKKSWNNVAQKTEVWVWLRIKIIIQRWGRLLIYQDKFKQEKFTQCCVVLTVVLFCRISIVRQCFFFTYDVIDILFLVVTFSSECLVNGGDAHGDIVVIFFLVEVSRQNHYIEIETRWTNDVEALLVLFQVDQPCKLSIDAAQHG